MGLLIYDTIVLAGESLNATPTPTPVAGTAINIGGHAATIPTSAMHFNPVFDWSPFTIGIFTLPLWFFITAFFVLILIVVFISWLFKINRMRGVKGYVQAADKGTQEDLQVWIFGKTKKLTIECLKYWGGMVHYPLGVKITKWRHASINATMNVGGQTAVAVSDDYDHTRDMVCEIALTVAGESFNDKIDEIRKYVNENRIVDPTTGKPFEVKPIESFHDYEKFGRRLMGILNPEGPSSPSYWQFDHARFRKFFPKGRDGDLSGGIFIRKSRKLKIRIKDVGIIAKLLPIGICIVFVGILIFGAMYVPLGK